MSADSHSSDGPIPEPVLDRATAWIVRLQEAPEDRALRAELADWIQASEVNAHAWSMTAQAWSRMGLVPPAHAHEWPARAAGRRMPAAAERPPARPAPRDALRLRRRLAGAVALALAACLVLALLLPTVRLELEADVTTGTGEMRQVAMADGSVIDLAPDSAIGIAYAADRRAVTLLRGEAYFEVADEAARPFTVQAGDVTVTVTGTAFDVGLTDRSVLVAVAGGTVQVLDAGGKDGPHSPAPIRLEGGRGVLIDRATGAVTPTAAAPGAVAAWRNGRLIVENVPLADVVETLGRYRSGAILLTDGKLAERRVTGGFDLADPGRALRVLVAPHGGTVTEITPYLTLLSGD